MKRHPTIDDMSLLRKYPAIADRHRAGESVRAAARASGVSASTVYHVRTAMARQGWTFEKRRDLTADDRIAGRPEVAFWLRAGRSASWTSQKCGVSMTTALTVRAALLSKGEKLVKWRRLGWPADDGSK